MTSNAIDLIKICPEDNNLNLKNHVIETSSVQHSAFKQCIRMSKLRELSRLVNTYMLHGKS